ncbi:MAG: Cof-type HAD-IIB family hydrolase [Erysipelotrichaceae bacterium]|nr:Cof-type HAD-IIB family hydrolase [Erysipelotrichaceae bacterium]MDY5251584.1 Cof-type HAD-IIB family hydrolase [Erysipelotrichaceae bacterium]
MSTENNIKLIVCDIDGTLVNDERNLTMLTKETLEKLHQKGIKFGIASGRAVSELKRFANLWNLSFPIDIIIGMNGAELWDEGQQKQFDYFKMKKSWIKEVLDIMRPFKLNPYMIKNDSLYCMVKDDLMERSSKRNGCPVIEVKDESEFYDEENAKIMFRMDRDKIDDIMAYAKERITGEYTAFKTQPDMIEFTHVKTDKANALLEYAKMNGIDMQDIMSFGDMTNDNGMLKASGIGVCLKNGGEDTKQCADYITEHTNNEDGFARFLIEHGYIIL